MQTWQARVAVDDGLVPSAHRHSSLSRLKHIASYQRTLEASPPKPSDIRRFVHFLIFCRLRLQKTKKFTKVIKLRSFAPQFDSHVLISKPSICISIIKIVVLWPSATKTTFLYTYTILV